LALHIFIFSDPCPHRGDDRLGDLKQFVEFPVFSFGRTGLSDFQNAFKPLETNMEKTQNKIRSDPPDT